MTAFSQPISFHSSFSENSPLSLSTQGWVQLHHNASVVLPVWYTDGHYAPYDHVPAALVVTRRPRGLGFAGRRDTLMDSFSSSVPTEICRWAGF